MSIGSRRRSPFRLRTGLLLLGLACICALAVQVWRLLQLEARARVNEQQRAEQIAEQILRQALQSPAVQAAMPSESQFQLDGGVVVDDLIGWLHPIGMARDQDAVVDYRLERAARAECLGAGSDAQQEFTALLQHPLPMRQRLRVLAAAIWFLHRHEPDRVASLVTEMDQALAKLDYAELARAAVALAVAARLRLPTPGGVPTQVSRLGNYLPAELAASMPPQLVDAAHHQRIVTRRDLLQRCEAQLEAEVDRALGVALALDGRILWCLPGQKSPQAGACASPSEFMAALRAASTAGALPQWPWAVEPQWSEDPSERFAGVPYLRGLRPAVATQAVWPWLLPAMTLVLLAGFGLALQQQFRASQREAQAVRAQAEFLTTVTHELKTPLTAIRLLGEMLQQGRAQGREAEYYRMLVGESERLSMLIENVLDLGRLERGERALDLRPVELGEQLREVLALFAPVAEQNGLVMEWTDEIQGPAWFRGDRAAHVQALICVLDNARKYAASGGKIELHTSDQGSHWQILVRDHGPGVPVAERERIFERFVRGSAHAQGTTPGLGLGLYLARSLMRRSGGDLDCVAPPGDGQGACLRFTLAKVSPP